MRNLLRTLIGGCILAVVALTVSGDASTIVPAAMARGFRWGVAEAAQQTGRAGAQQAGGGGQPAGGGQPTGGGQQANGGQQQNDQQAPAEPPQSAPAPVFRGGINFVRVDVIVSDKNGNTVADLKQGDFDILEDGKPQTVETFKLIKLDGGAVPTPEGPPREIRTDEDEQAEAAKDDVRLFAIFLDDYHVRRGASMVAGNPISRFVETQLGPSDMIGVMRPLESIDSVRMTRNHSVIARAIQQFRGRKGDYTPQNEFEERYSRYPAETVEQIRNQVSLSAMKSLIVHMGGLKEGRKSLIVVSEGYSNTLPAQLRSPVAGVPVIGNSGGGGANEAAYQFFQSQDLEFFMRGIYEVASQNNVAIYTVDPRGLPVFEFDINDGVSPTADASYLRSTQETLRALAIETDGRAILNRNDLDVGMKQIVRDSSAYYLIGYTSAQVKADGKFHAINVKVKRSGVQVRARKGYWALAPETAAAIATAAAKPGPPPAVTAALATITQPERSRVVRTWIGTSRGDHGKTKVTFVWEPIPKAPGERQAGAGDQPARVSLMAVGPDGSAYFRGRVPALTPEATLASSAPPSAASAPSGGTAAPGPRGPSRVAFEVNPGKMQLRVSVEGAGSQVLDSEVRDITVPDLTSSEVVISTPEVFHARTLREYQQLKADADAVPIAIRDFSRSERVFVRVTAYAPGTSLPMVKVRLLDRKGQPMSDLAVTPASTPGGPSQIDLPLTGLAVGDYILEIAAGGEAEGATRQLVGFRVTS